MIRIVKLNKDNRGKGGATLFVFKIRFIDQTFSITDDNDNKRLINQVLSKGDKSSLALAFFLSNFQSEKKGTVIIVLDDPISSLDLHRRETTIKEVSRLVTNNYQVFIFSHDAHFLSDIKNYSNLSLLSNCYELDARYFDLNPYDANSSKYCNSSIIYRNDFDRYVLHSYQQEYNDLARFVAEPIEEDKTAIARSIRPILEAYLRLLLPHHFTKNMWLGSMISEIRSEKDETSPLFDKHDRLKDIEEINEFSKTYHHAEGFDTRVQSLDLNEVHVYAKLTFRFITGL